MNLRPYLPLLCCLAYPLLGEIPDRITGNINSGSFITLPNAALPAVASSGVSRPVDPLFALDQMILVLTPSASQQASLQALLKDQQDPASANFHKFLTPSKFAESFGVSQNDVDKIVKWLTSSGFKVDEVQANHLAIVFSGNAAQVEAVFKTQISQFVVNGKIHHANTTAPRIPAALAGVVQGVVKLNDFHTKTPAARLKSLYTLGPTTHYLVPADFAVIYDLNPLFTNGFTGAGQNIAVVGRSNVNPNDIANFRLAYGLPSNAVTTVFASGTDPGIATNGDDLEATLDVEWAGAIAPKAGIELVIAGSTASTDGVDIAAQYAVNHNVASILSVSFGACEAVANNSFYNSLWQQAAVQGISVFVSGGDSGVAGCDSSNAASGTGKGVNGLCSSPYDTCVGGTMFDDTGDPALYWLPANNAVMGSAVSYIPEVVWNESGLAATGAGLAAGAGGVSAIYLKPFWQIAPGVPADGRRDVPDVSLNAAQHDGYAIVYGGATWVVSGTSAGAPSFAGIIALLNQKSGGALGNINPVLYSLAARGTQSNALPIFHDVRNGNNSVPGVTGYDATAGYDLASGLGSVDAAQLVNNWDSVNSGFSIAASVQSVSASPGQNGTVTLTVADFGSFNSPVTLSVASLPPNVIANFSPATLISGTSVLTLAASGSATSGTYPITVTAAAGGQTRTASFNLVVVISTNCTLTAMPASVTVLQSQATSTKLVCGNAQGKFASSLILSVSGVPTGVSTSFSPATLAAGTGVSTFLINATSAARPGSYALVVTATLPNASPAFAQTLSIPLVINAPSTFDVIASASSVSFQQGASGTLVLTSSHRGAFNSPVSFSTSGLPSTVSASFSLLSIPAPGDGVTTISLQGMSVVPAGTYTMMVLAQGAGLSLRIPISVQITPAPAFLLTASAAALTLPHSTVTTPGTVPITFTTGTLTNNFNLPVSFSVSGLPPGVTYGFSSATIAAPGAGSTVLTLTGATTVTAGVSTFTVTAVGGTITRALNVRLITSP